MAISNARLPCSSTRIQLKCRTLLPLELYDALRHRLGYVPARTTTVSFSSPISLTLDVTGLAEKSRTPPFISYLSFYLAT
ncbi:hypothetical protein QR680_011658 [Steinernema hermaphroditum]|uniref:Uncharacterized protein n=1 Tax=Steinernema hermaphroditum TaxID=289476 RepID=A0AA39I1J5_9BILA|nr:hypothetical protein QR680_011658 [Steinernema hermaphroditum]